MLTRINLDFLLLTMATTTTTTTVILPTNEYLDPFQIKQYSFMVSLDDIFNFTLFLDELVMEKRLYS